MERRRIIAETGAGQRSVATATVCALFGLDCTVYMGEEDVRQARQRRGVFRMRLLGANVVGVNQRQPGRSKTPSARLCATGVTNVATTHYLLGSARSGPASYPTMVRDFHRALIGVEALAADSAGGRPSRADAVFACVGGGSNAIGIFHPFVEDEGVKLIGVEAGGRGDKLGEHAARFAGGFPGVLHGSRSYILQDEHGQISATHSVSAGVDYAWVGPEHAWLHDRGRAEYCACCDKDALDAAKNAEPY